MKIEKRSVYITEVRGLDGIEVETSGVVRVISASIVAEYTPEALGAVIEALQAAHREALAMQGVPARELRVFTKETGIPDEVTEVSDRDGDEWCLNAEGYWDAMHLSDSSYRGYTPGQLLRNHGPLTEVLG